MIAATRQSQLGRGSVIGSWLMDLTADALARSPDLDTFAGRVSDSGEGRWTVEAAIDLGVPAQVITTALYERFGFRSAGTRRRYYRDTGEDALIMWRTADETSATG